MSCMGVLQDGLLAAELLASGKTTAVEGSIFLKV